MKKTAFLIALIMLLAVFTAACGDNKDENGGLKIVTTVFPVYDWVREIAGDEAVSITLLTENGTDIHSYQPTLADISAISECDLFIYIGGESEQWVDAAVKNNVGEKTAVLDLMEGLSGFLKEEETVEGMEREDGGEEETAFDEHIWLSLRCAARACELIEKALCEANGEKADTYRLNSENYRTKLVSLDANFSAAVSNANNKTLVFADRFPFRYLVDDYGIKYYAAFAGCSSETAASLKTVVFLAEKVDELGLKNILTIEGTNGGIADAVILNTENKDQKTLVLNSLQSVTKKDIENGMTYLSAMESNLSVLRQALGRE